MKANTGLESVAATEAAADVFYDSRTIQLHWLTAILMALLWTIAQIIDLFPKGAPKIAVRSTHIVLGIVLGIVLLIRIVWRTRTGRKLPLASDGVVGHLARTVHLALYAGLASVILLGILNAWARGDSIFGLLHLPKLYPTNPQLKPTVEYLHKTFANALMIVAAAHGLAAMIHHVVLRDAVLRRMLPWLQAKGKSPRAS